MIKNPERHHSFDRKRLRHEKRTHEDKKRKRSKKDVEESIIEQIESVKFPQIVISNDSSLFSSQIMITSQYVYAFERILTLTLNEFENTRARALSDEIEKARRQYQIERVKSMSQSTSLFADDEFTYEYDFITLQQEELNRTTSFTLINRRNQQVQQASRLQMISHTFSIDDQTSVSTNIVFDLKGFLSEMKDIIFDQKSIEKDVLINQMRVDLNLKRIVLESFNENEVIMRRVIKFDNIDQKIDLKDKSKTYRVYRETSLKIKDIIYRRD